MFSSLSPLPCSFSVITLYLPFPTHHIYLPPPGFLLSGLNHISSEVLIQGDHFLYRCRAFVESKHLFKINFQDYLLCFFFPILHSFMCILLLNSLCCSLGDEEKKIASKKIGSRNICMNNTTIQTTWWKSVIYKPIRLVTLSTDMKSEMWLILIWHLWDF